MQRSTLTFLLAIPFVVAAYGSEVTTPAPADAGVDSRVDVSVDDAADASVAEDVPQDTGSSAEDVRTFVPDASSPMTAIEAAPEAWTYVPFPDSACGNGTPAGIGVNLTTRSNRVVIYLQGGGACWDGLTCFLPTAANINNAYTNTTFQSEIRAMSRGLMFNRDDARNPFRDASFVYVPYCTGDIHGGDNVRTYLFGSEERTIYHVGARNMDAFLRRLARTFPSADRVWLTGASAGGYGAGIHWDRVQRAFPAARVDLLDDSGPPIRPPAERFNQMKAAWNLQFPDGCTTCADDLTTLLDYYATRLPPPHRMGLLSYTQDRTISQYFGLTGAQFQDQLSMLMRSAFDARPNYRYFVVAGSNHTMVGDLGTLTGPGGASLLRWVTAWATDGADWNNVRP